MQTNRRSVLLGAAVAASVAFAPALAKTPVEIQLFFPVPVEGQVARDMAALIREFNAAHTAIKVTPVYTGGYDETLIKTRAAMRAGKPPEAVIMSANLLLDLQIEKEIQPLDDLIDADGKTNTRFMSQFFSALHGNAVINRSVYGVPFQNSTPLLYINADQFRAVGLDPDKLPDTWQDLVDAAKKLTIHEGGRTTRWGITLPSDYSAWILQALTMSNGGQWFNPDFGGEVYYDTPSMLGAVSFWSDLIMKHKVHPAGLQPGGAVVGAFLAGQTAMMMGSTGSLTHIRGNAKFAYKVAFVPKHLAHAVPIGGASLVIPTGVAGERRKAAWTLIKWLTSPEKSAWWSRATGYFAPNRAAYETPEMKAFIAAHPDAELAVKQLDFARAWFATYKTVPVRKALEDELLAVLSGAKPPRDALVAAQKQADAILRPYVEQTALKLPTP